jgi:hypothetical protein
LLAELETYRSLGRSLDPYLGESACNSSGLGNRLTHLLKQQEVVSFSSRGGVMVALTLDALAAIHDRIVREVFGEIYKAPALIDAIKLLGDPDNWEGRKFMKGDPEEITRIAMYKSNLYL